MAKQTLVATAGYLDDGFRCRSREARGPTHETPELIRVRTLLDMGSIGTDIRLVIHELSSRGLVELVVPD